MNEDLHKAKEKLEQHKAKDVNKKIQSQKQKQDDIAFYNKTVKEGKIRLSDIAKSLGYKPYSFIASLFSISSKKFYVSTPNALYSMTHIELRCWTDRQSIGHEDILIRININAQNRSYSLMVGESDYDGRPTALTFSTLEEVIQTIIREIANGHFHIW